MKKETKKFVLRIPKSLVDELDEIRKAETVLSRNAFFLGILCDYLARTEAIEDPIPSECCIDEMRKIAENLSGIDLVMAELKAIRGRLKS